MYQNSTPACLALCAAARKAKRNDVACFAARAAGQAVATAHVPQHAFGAAYYAIKVVAATNPSDAGVKLTKEINWQLRRLPKKLRRDWQDWLTNNLPKNLKKLLKD